MNVRHYDIYDSEVLNRISVGVPAFQKKIDSLMGEIGPIDQNEKGYSGNQVIDFLHGCKAALLEYSEYVLGVLAYENAIEGEHSDPVIKARFEEEILELNAKIAALQSQNEILKEEVSERDKHLLSDKAQFLKELNKLQEQVYPKDKLQGYQADSFNLFSPQEWMKQTLGDLYDECDDNETLQKKAKIAIDRMADKYEKEKKQLEEEIKKLEIERDTQISGLRKTLLTKEKELAVQRMEQQREMKTLVTDTTSSYQKSEEEFIKQKEEEKKILWDELAQLKLNMDDIIQNKIEAERKNMEETLATAKANVEEIKRKVKEKEGEIKKLREKIKIATKGSIETPANTDGNDEELANLDEVNLNLRLEEIEKERDELLSRVSALEEEKGIDSLSLLKNGAHKQLKSAKGNRSSEHFSTTVSSLTVTTKTNNPV